MNSTEALEMAAKAMGMFNKVVFLISSEHVNDAKNLKLMSRRVAIKAAKDLKNTADAYGEALTELQRMFLNDVDEQTIIESCQVFTFSINGRLDELTSLFTPYKKLAGYAKNARLQSMIKEG